MDTSHDLEFEKLVENLVRFKLRTNPVEASFLGIHDYDQELSDYSPGGIKNRINKLTSFKKIFKNINKRLLNIENQVDLELILGRIEIELQFEKKYPHYKIIPDKYLNEILYGVYVLVSRDFAPARQRAMSITRRLAMVQNQLRHARKHLKNPPKVFVESGISTCKGAVAFLDTVVSGFTQNISGALKFALLEANNEAIKELEKFGDFLETELLPKAKFNFPIGKTLYNMTLKHEHKLPYTHDKLQIMAKKQIRSIERQMKNLAGEISKTKSWQEIVEGLKKDHPSAQGLVGAYKREMKKARQFVLNKELVTFPEDEVIEVVPTPIFARPLIPFAAYVPPAPMDESTGGMFWVSTTTGMPTNDAEKILKDHSKWGLAITALHEAYPGHHLQQSIAKQNKNILRHLYTSIVFAEGWAFYCEDLMWKEEYYSNPKERLLQLKDALWRGYRVLIDVGLHTKSITYEKAVKILVEKIGLAEASAVAEVNRYCQTPTYPMSYLIGKLEIDALYKDYKKKSGKSFSQKEFHDELLSFGTIPVSLIRKLMGL